MKAMDGGSSILFVVAFIVGIPSLLFVVRAIQARYAATRVLWIARAFALLGAALAIAFPGVLYRELVDIALPRGAEIDWMPTGIAQTALLIPLTVIPAFVSLRWTLLGGLLFLVNAIVSLFFIVYDPFVAFPYRDVTGGLLFDVGPRLLTSALLLVAATIAPHTRCPCPSPLRSHLRRSW